MESISFTIPIAPLTKKNHQKISWNKYLRRPLIVQNSQYLVYERDCKWFMPKIKTVDYPINLKCIYYMPTKRRVDITNLMAATHDILVKYGVISDDNRDIVASVDGSRVYYDKTKPRTEIEITKIKEYKQWKVKNE